MVSLEEISAIGSGLYRMSVNSETHYDSLLYSINKGYNLIDTSSTYLYGDSELLVGKLLTKNKNLSDKLFIISKAGYYDGKISQIKTKLFLDSNESQMAFIKNESSHCIHRKYIEYQFEKSLTRINKGYIDCFLIHNPERYLKSANKNDKKLVYELIKDCFQFFEEKIIEGKLRYYGISCNKITNPTKATHLDFRKVISIAEKINSDHKFKFLQIPFNFLEQDANNKHYNNNSLIELAKIFKIKLIGNRPFNMDQNGSTLQMVSYKKFYKNESPNTEIFENFYTIVNTQVIHITKNENKASDFEPIKLLKDNWTNFLSTDNVNSFWENYIIPFINTIFDQPSEEIITVCKKMKEQMNSCVYRNITNKSSDFIKLLKEKDDRFEIKNNIALTTINYYVNVMDIDHVLVGMRRKEYVDDFSGKFNS